MKISQQLTDEAILGELGGRLASVRIAHNLTQAALAHQSGLGLNTVRRLESGEVASRLSALIRVCRVLGLSDRLDDLAPETGISPIAQLKVTKKQRKRVRGHLSEKDNGTPWKWGEA